MQDFSALWTLGVWGAHAWRGEGAPPPSARAISGVPPENLFGETPNTTLEDAYAPQRFRSSFGTDCILVSTINASGWRRSASAAHSFRTSPLVWRSAFIGFDDLKDGTEFGGFQVLVSAGKCERKAFRHGKPWAAQILREFVPLTFSLWAVWGSS
jgi:hypothetical protein